MSKVKVVLKFPVLQGSEEIKELELRRPKGKDLRKLPAEPATGDVLNLGASLAGVTPSVIDEMDAQDVMALVEVVQSFLSRSVSGKITSPE